jgi:hypothetical protein
MMLDRAIDGIDARWRRAAPAARLATLRILSGAFATAYLWVRLGYFADCSHIPADQFAPIGIVGVLDAPLSPAVTWPLAIGGAILGFAFTTGWQFRFTGPLFAAAFLWLTSYRSSWGMVFHTENLVALHLVVLSLSRSADALSHDARRRAGGRAPASDDPRYGWPIRLMCTITVATYLIAGIAKLQSTGVAWAFSDFLHHYVAYDALRKIEQGGQASPIGIWFLEVPWIWKPFATVSLAVELCAPLALLGRRSARVWVLAAWVFHLGVAATMWILFPYPLVAFAFASFFEVEKLAAARSMSRKAKSQD